MANNTITSKGTLGLPNFRSSRVSTSLWEPIYKSFFTVQLTPPEGMGLQKGGEQKVLVVLEGIKDINGLNTSKSSGSPVEQKYKFASRRFAGAVPDTKIDITINWELNLSYDNGHPENYTWKFLRAWNDLIYDPQSGRMGLKKDYAASQMIITAHDRAGTAWHQWVLHYAFPTTDLNSLESWSYTSNDIQSASVKYACDFWDEVTL